MTALTKNMLRKQFHSLRQAVADSEQAAHSHQLLKTFSEEASFHSYSPVGGYIATHHEADPTHIIERLFNLNASICLPKTDDRGEIIFYQWKIGDSLESGKFGIPEPAVTKPLIPTLILVPLLAYDAEGYRLGYGGGYYDRTLARPEYNNSFFLGVAYRFQRSESLPHNAHDVRLHAVLTEEGIEWFR